jgi:hypothetical protein
MDEQTSAGAAEPPPAEPEPTPPVPEPGTDPALEESATAKPGAAPDTPTPGPADEPKELKAPVDRGS